MSNETTLKTFAVTKQVQKSRQPNNIFYHKVEIKK